MQTVTDANINLFAYVAQCLASGNFDALGQAELSPRDLLHLRQLKLSQLIAMSARGSDLRGYLKEASYDCSSAELEQALLGHSAPRELMTSLGMNARRYTAERRRHRMTGPRGRPAIARIDAATEQRLWRLWITLANDRDPRRLRQADNWLLIALEVPGHLRTAWSLIQRWAQDEEALSAFAGDRIRLTSQRLALSELKLRDKHGLNPPHDQRRGSARHQGSPSLP